MIDQAIIQTYIDASCGNRNEKSKNNLAVLLSKFFSLSPGSSLDNLTRQDLIKMLAESSIMSMNTFDSVKSKIKGFLKWLCDNGYCPEELLESWQSIRFSDINRSDFYDRYFFKDYSELCDTIQGVFGEVSSEYDPVGNLSAEKERLVCSVGIDLWSNHKFHCAAILLP